MKKFILGVLLSVACSLSFAVTRTAVSCSIADITTQTNLAVSGDVVQIPSGTCSWTTGGINIPGGVTVQGVSSTSTIINWNGTGTALYWAGSNCRVTGLRVNRTGSGGSITGQAPTAMNCTLDNTILNNGDFSGTSNAMFYHEIGSNTSAAYSATWGLFYNNQFIGLNGENALFKGPCNSWKTATSVGGQAAWFFEDNTFSSSSSAYLDFHNNARVVIRNNTVSNVYFDGHGVWSNVNECSGQTLRGGSMTTPYDTRGSRGVRSMEVYNNTWTSVSNFRIIYPRGGTGVIYGNRITAAKDGFNQMIMLDEYCARDSGPTSSDRAGCVSSCPSSAATPLLDQIGRGMDIVSLPVDGTGQQTSEPFLIWDNLYTSDNTKIFMSPGNDNTGFGAKSCASFSDLSVYIVAGRDYCMGTGAQSTIKPTTCNGSNVTYTSYTYPHPLRSGVIIPNAPTHFRVASWIENLFASLIQIVSSTFA